MNFLWLIILVFANFSRFSNENAAGNHRDGVLYPKKENLVLPGSININGSSSSSVPAPLPSKLYHESSTQNLPNVRPQSVEPTGFQPKVQDAEGGLHAGLQWKSQNEQGWRELNSWLGWWWIKRGYQGQSQQLQTSNGRQQYQLRWMHHRWRQQPSQPLSQQQYYRRRHQQSVKKFHLQNWINTRRQNAINQESDVKIMNRSQLNLEQVGNAINVQQQEKFNLKEGIMNRSLLRTVYPDGHLAQNELQNSALVDGHNKSNQKLESTFSQQSQKLVNNQLQNVRNTNAERKNQAPNLLDIRNNQETPTKPAFDIRQQILEQGQQQFGHSSSDNLDQLASRQGKESPISMPQSFVNNQVNQQKSNSSSSSQSEADEEPSSSTESYWRSQELYPMWKPPSPLFGIFPVMDIHSAKDRNVPLKREGSTKPLAMSGSQLKSDEELQKTDISNTLQETWVLGLNLSYKKVSRKSNKLQESEKKPSEQFMSNSLSPSSQQHISTLQSKEDQPIKFTAMNNELVDQKKISLESNVPVSKPDNLSKGSDILITPRGKQIEEQHREQKNQKDGSKIKPEYNIKTNQIKEGNITLKNPALTGQDIKSQVSTIDTNPDMYLQNRLQVPSSHQKKIKANDSFAEKFLQPGGYGSLQKPLGIGQTITKPGNIHEQIQSQQIQITPQPSSTLPLTESIDMSTSEPPLTPRLENNEISPQTGEPIYQYESSTEISAEELKEYGLQGSEIMTKFTNKNNSNSLAHPISVRFDQSSQSGYTSNTMPVETDENLPGIFTKQNTSDLVKHNLNVSTNSQYSVLRKPQIENKPVSNTEKSQLNQQLVQTEFSSSSLDSNHTSSNHSGFTDRNQLGKKYSSNLTLQLFRSSEDRVSFVHSLRKRTIDSRGSFPMETDNQRLSNMESLGGPINIDPYEIPLQNNDPSESAVDLELSSNEMEYLFQTMRNGMKLLINSVGMVLS